MRNCIVLNITDNRASYLVENLAEIDPQMVVVVNNAEDEIDVGIF